MVALFLAAQVVPIDHPQGESMSVHKPSTDVSCGSGRRSRGELIDAVGYGYIDFTEYLLSSLICSSLLEFRPMAC